MTTLMITAKKTMPMIASSGSWPLTVATTASVAPRLSAPESPMKICAGWTLNHRNPIRAPMTSAQKIARFGCCQLDARRPRPG